MTASTLSIASGSLPCSLRNSGVEECVGIFVVLRCVTATLSSLIGLLRKIQPYVVSFQNEFPALKKSPVVMLDAGAGTHIPGVLFAILGRFNSIGIEIDKNRCALAAHFLSHLMERYPDINISLWNHDIAVPGNWSKVTVFFVWDRVSGDFLNVCCIFRLLQGSIEVSFGLMSI